ncbi:MAG: hypothetical protein HF973_03805 [Chloroflexi bacterium]|nr:hypothetical protein [Chloroflexota bacterium]
MKNQSSHWFHNFKRKLEANRTNWFAFFFYILLTLIAAWPVISNLNGVIIGLDNDVYINPWADWWTLKALTDPQLSLWQTDYMLYPQGANLIYHSFSHLTTLVSLSLRPFLGTLPAYNITMLLNIVLAGFSMFQLARYLTKSTTAGLLAGIVFAFNSHNLYQTAHPVLAAVWCLPWAALYFIKAVRENNLKYAFVAAVFVFLGTAVSTILLILMGIWFVFLLFYMLIFSEFPRPPWRILLTFGLTSLLLTFPLLFPLLQDALTNGNNSFVTDPQRSLVTNIASLALPRWREWPDSYFWLKRGLYIGFVPAILALLAAIFRWRKARLWLLLFVLAFLFAIGPVPQFLGYRPDIVFPWTLPIAPILRNMYRMMILFSLGLAMLVAYGWTVLADFFRSAPGKKMAAAFIVGTLIFLDYTAGPFPTSPATVSLFYTTYLHNIPDDAVLAILPTGRQPDKRYMYYQIYHEQPTINGVISRSDPAAFAFIYNNPLLRAGVINKDTPITPIPADSELDAALQELTAVNVKYLILDKQLMTKNGMGIEQWRNVLPLTPIFEDDLLLVYATP